ncbi:hypothetical protein MP228_006806 [Amoeboaphelidium protococcarum]|nr:hypothetical protein MP228_006806 [Amoeboaphelidium protococcarum]
MAKVLRSDDDHHQHPPPPQLTKTDSNSSILQCEQHYQKIRNLLNKQMDHRVESKQLMQILDYNEKIHLSLVKVRSRQSGIISDHNHSLLKKRLADVQAKEMLKDKRFTRAFALDKVPEFKSSLSIELHNSYFKIGLCQTLFPYQGPYYKILVELVEYHEFGPELLKLLDLSSAVFYEGGIVVELTIILNEDDRNQEVVNIMAFPTAEALMVDLERVKDKLQLSESQMLEFEAKILTISHQVCLNPSPLVGRSLNQVEYNKRKFNIVKRHDYRQFRFTDQSVLSVSEEDSEMEMIMAFEFNLPGSIAESGGVADQIASSNKSSIGNGSSLINGDCSSNDNKNAINAGTTNTNSAAQAFKRKNFFNTLLELKSAEAEKSTQQLPSVDKNSQRGFRRRDRDGVLQKLIRTIRYVKQPLIVLPERKQPEPQFTIVNIYANSDSTFDIEIGCGSEVDTCKNGYHRTFTLTDSSQTELYLRHFNMLYTQCEQNQLSNDYRSQNDVNQIVYALQQQQQKLDKQDKIHSPLLAGGIKPSTDNAAALNKDGGANGSSGQLQNGAQHLRQLSNGFSNIVPLSQQLKQTGSTGKSGKGKAQQQQQQQLQQTLASQQSSNVDLAQSVQGTSRKHSLGPVGMVNLSPSTSKSQLSGGLEQSQLDGSNRMSFGGDAPQLNQYQAAQSNQSSITAQSGNMQRANVVTSPTNSASSSTNSLIPMGVANSNNGRNSQLNFKDLSKFQQNQLKNQSLLQNNADISGSSAGGSRLGGVQQQLQLQNQSPKSSEGGTPVNLSKAFVQQLLKMPPDQVPEEYKNFTAQLKLKIAKHQQMKSRQLAGQGQSSPQQQQQQSATPIPADTPPGSSVNSVPLAQGNGNQLSQNLSQLQQLQASGLTQQQQQLLLLKQQQQQQQQALLQQQLRLQQQQQQQQQTLPQQQQQQQMLQSQLTMQQQAQLLQKQLLNQSSAQQLLQLQQQLAQQGNNGSTLTPAQMLQLQQQLLLQQQQQQSMQSKQQPQIGKTQSTLNLLQLQQQLQQGGQLGGNLARSASSNIQLPLNFSGISGNSNNALGNIGLSNSGASSGLDLNNLSALLGAQNSAGQGVNPQQIWNSNQMAAQQLPQSQLSQSASNANFSNNQAMQNLLRQQILLQQQQLQQQNFNPTLQSSGGKPKGGGKKGKKQQQKQ